MPPILPASGGVRRARGREWKRAEKDLYRQLVDEWVEAERREMTTAA